MHQELRRSPQQEALQLSRAEAELQRLTETNAELQEEVRICACTVLMFPWLCGVRLSSQE